LTERKTAHLSAEVDSGVLGYLDTYVTQHPGASRDQVVEEALRLWRAREIEREMEEQFAKPDGVDPAEREVWMRVARASLIKMLDEHPDDQVPEIDA
jgi:hypothetical protein